MKTQIVKTVLLFMVMNMTVPVFASTDPVVMVNKNITTEDVRGMELLNRLKEIKAMKKSDLSREERKALRKEVKAIKKELSTDHKGIYLSFGAAILIVLLLILIL